MGQVLPKPNFRIYLKANLRLADEIVLEAVYPSSTTEGRYGNTAREGAFLAVLTEWFQSGMLEGDEEMAAICEKIFRREGASIW